MSIELNFHVKVKLSKEILILLVTLLLLVN